MSVVSVLSLFGWSFGPFPVPVETSSAVECRRGQGRPSGRRVSRLALDGCEHGRTVTAIETIGETSRASRATAALFSLIVGVYAALPANAQPLQQGDMVAAAVDEASVRFGLPPAWIRLVLQQESGGDTRAVSPKGAMGLMQLMPSTWRDLGAELSLGNDPFDPRANILAGAAYLRRMYDRYGSPGFLAAYNAGPARYERYLLGSGSLPAETRNYVARLAPRLSVATRDERSPTSLDWRSCSLFVDAGSELLPRGDRP